MIGRSTFDDRFNLALTECLETIKKGLEQTASELASWNKFQASVIKICKERSLLKDDDGRQFEQKVSLRRMFGKQGSSGMIQYLERLYRDYKLDKLFSPIATGQDTLADFRFPPEWYPVARSMQRKIHLHVGPTNSGKTYHALQKLEKAKSGFYGGPLRLLAHEIYTRLNKKGISCALITGDEVRVPEGDRVTIFSNTVEMVPIGQEVEVGVIDEIQMIADPNRGWAWTRAVLGCQAKELHLCGEERAVPLIRQLVSLMGDTLEIHNYKRLNPLKTMTSSLKGDIKRLEKGDCVVSFSRVGIHALKQEIEKATGRRAAIVYGSLPAEIRAQQADLFNDPDNDYDFLVASDAIGMGLNLSCKRIIFDSVMKRLPTGIRQLSVSEVKQIGGRAGRYRSAAQSSNSFSNKNGKDNNENVGLVTCLEEGDLRYIREAMMTEAQPLDAAGILPLDCVVERFSNMFPPDTPSGYIYKRLERVSRTDSPFFMCQPQDTEATFGLLDDIKGLNMVDKMVFMSAPLRATDPVMAIVIKAFAECVGQKRSGALLDIPELDLEILDKPVSGDDKEYLRSLEALHRSLILYLWLGYRFGGVFVDRTLATHAKEMVEVKMDRTLTEFSANSKLRKQTLWKRRLKAAKEKFISTHAEEPTGIVDSISDTPELEETPEQLGSSSGTVVMDHPMDIPEPVVTSAS
ncbi:ATP-dependent RNA helicase suv3 [Arthroderma uncinatum]|uniref:ATP-dependent RNA helicase suv3 n=1 Tax=Arthroderma uncinatum TaxID=74035 RepID=UPI00144AA34D|nr:ATP-dependent RNA helicase suv3 [Arthroderma uncinatum]KAF3483049.1 ATP-dependent RNA helicase suv3 [Arthroderma uncinatum]